MNAPKTRQPKSPTAAAKPATDSSVPDNALPGAKRASGRLHNTDLYMLYTRWATQHLLTLTRHHKELQEFSNTNLLDACCSVVEQYRTLIVENMTYRDAHEILRGLGLGIEIEGFEPDQPDAVDATASVDEES